MEISRTRKRREIFFEPAPAVLFASLYAYSQADPCFSRFVLGRKQLLTGALRIGIQKNRILATGPDFIDNNKN